MNNQSIKEQLLVLGNFGCKGSVFDFRAWLGFYYRHYSESNVKKALNEFVQNGIFEIRPDTSDYSIKNFPDPGTRVAYEVPSSVMDSPIQLVRSRLESFLRFHRANTVREVDIIVGVTEAMENAVKYGAPSNIHISYSIENDQIDVEIINQIVEPSAEADILLGKYSESSRTLMRGLMMMQKLFVEMDLVMDEDNSRAIFSARGNLH